MFAADEAAWRCRNSRDHKVNSFVEWRNNWEMWNHRGHRLINVSDHAEFYKYGKHVEQELRTTGSKGAALDAKLDKLRMEVENARAACKPEPAVIGVTPLNSCAPSRLSTGNQLARERAKQRFITEYRGCFKPESIQEDTTIEAQVAELRRTR